MDNADGLLNWTQCYKLAIIADLKKIHQGKDQSPDICSFQFSHIQPIKGKADNIFCVYNYRNYNYSDLFITNACAILSIDTGDISSHHGDDFPENTFFRNQMYNKNHTEYDQKTIDHLNLQRKKNNLALLGYIGMSTIQSQHKRAVGCVQTDEKDCTWYLCSGSPIKKRCYRGFVRENECNPVLALPQLDGEDIEITLFTQQDEILVFFEDGRIGKITPQHFPLKLEKANNIFFRWK